MCLITDGQIQLYWSTQLIQLQRTHNSAMSSSGQKRATVVQIKRRVHETAAEAVSIGPKRAKTAAPEAVAAAEAVVPAETVRAEAAASEAAAAAAAAARSARAGERVVLKRLQSFTQRDIDQGEHLKLLVRLLKGRRSYTDRASPPHSPPHQNTTAEAAQGAAGGVCAARREGRVVGRSSRHLAGARTETRSGSAHRAAARRGAAPPGRHSPRGHSLVRHRRRRRRPAGQGGGGDVACEGCKLKLKRRRSAVFQLHLNTGYWTVCTPNIRP